MSPFKSYEPLGPLKYAHLSKIIQHPETIERISEWTKKSQGFLYITGNAGTGKSYIASAIKNYWQEQKKMVRYFSESNLFEELKICINMPSSPPDYRIDVISESEFFILDDFGSTLSNDRDKSEWKKEMLFKLIDIRYSLNLPSVITSNLLKSELKAIFHERFISRLYSIKNEVFDISGPDRRQSPQFELP